MPTTSFALRMDRLQVPDVFNVKNKKAIMNLSNKSFIASKTRNVIAVIAIALTTILFTSLFTIGIGMVESIQQQTMRQSGSDGHMTFKYLTEDQYQKLSSHKLVKEAGYRKIIADRVTNLEFLKRQLEISYMDETAMRLGFCTPTTGKAPLAADEIAMDTISLNLLGVPHTVGSKVTLSYMMGKKEFTSDFVLSGFWESDMTVPIGTSLVSEEFTHVNAEALAYTFHQDYKYAGVINCIVMCTNGNNLQARMEQILLESGYTLSDDDASTPPLATDISCNTNWAYIGSGGSTDAGAIVAVIAALLLITFTGYLIIFNVFQISVLRDIRFYGLLKTIGTTGRQLKRIVTQQALLLSAIGIPVGLVVGFVSGKAILPLMMAQTSYNGESSVSIHPMIFIGASIFSLLTVFLSTRKPCKIAARVSPIEAVKYSGEGGSTKKAKHSKDGGKVYRMAFSNLSRNKKRTIITVFSLSLSLVLLNTVFTIATGFDMDKYLSKFVDTDFLAGHANYFNMNRFKGANDATSEKMISEIETHESFLEGGRLYFNTNLDECSIDQSIDEGALVSKAANGKPVLQLFGLEKLPLSRIDVYEGELDYEKLATGKYIIEGVFTDDDNKIHPDTSHYSIGDKVNINVDGKPYEFEVLCKMKISNYTNFVRYSIGEYVMYLPAEIYKNIVNDPIIMSYAYNTKDGAEEQMEAFIKHYTENVEQTMNYESKLTYVKSFENMQSMIVTVGGILSGIMGLIGLLNFVNSILTSITTRRREFATLQSIGMTKKQLVRMLCLEGLYYVIMTAAFSLIIGATFSLIVVGGIVSTLWMFSYHFTLIPILVVCPILLALGVLIPIVAYRSAGKQSLVERLREVE